MEELILFPKDIGEITPTGLTLRDGLSFAQWHDVGSRLQQVEKSVLWWVGDWLNYGERRYGEQYTQALEETGFSLGTLQKAKWVASRIETCLRRQDLSYKAHQEVASLPPEQQAEVIDQAEGMTVREVRQLVRAKKRGDPDICGAITNGTGRYSCIVIDPPWDMEKIERDVRPNQVGFDYPTMDEAELSAMDIGALSEADTHLFCWTTQRFLPMALRLLETWGWDYVLTMVWHKAGGIQPYGLPQYNCEFVLYGRRGSPKFTDTKAFPCCFTGGRREHSRKPEEFYDLIRRVTEGRRIDMFAREDKDGFDRHGNELRF